MSAKVHVPLRRLAAGWLRLALLALIASSLVWLVVAPSLVRAQGGRRVDLVQVDGTTVGLVVGRVVRPRTRSSSCARPATASKRCGGR